MRSGFDEPTLLELFREEVRSQIAALTEHLLALEAGGGVVPERLATLMRAAHSIKGAAKIVGREVVLRLAHAMEDWFVSAQQGQASVTAGHLDVLFGALDLMSEAAALDADAVRAWNADHESAVQTMLHRLSELRYGRVADASSSFRSSQGAHGVQEAPVSAGNGAAAPRFRAATGEQRISAGSLDRLLGLTGEAVIASRMLVAHAAESREHRRAQQALGIAIDELMDALTEVPLDARGRLALNTLEQHLTERRELRMKRDVELEGLSQGIARISDRLYQEVLDSRMRPFEEGTLALPRMVRDICRELGKEVRLVLAGGSTRVDREVLRRLEVPLVHLLRNAVDHGVESAGERRARGKPESATINVTARHGGGRLLVTVQDDGRGVDLAAMREAVVRHRHADATAAAVMTDQELLEFLFLPGFTLREQVTELSGRGVGLDAVRTAIHEIGGTVRVVTTTGQGARFELQLPLTLSVVRALIVEVGGQQFAIALARIRCVLRVPRDQIESVEGRQHFSLRGRHVGLMWAHQVLGMDTPGMDPDEASVIVVDDHDASFGLAVDGLIGEQDVVLRGLDPQLGKVPNVGAAALLPDGSPVLVLDVDDVVRSIANLLAGERLDPLRRCHGVAAPTRKRVLIADDSLTVRELERKLIASRGYDVDVAVDGMDAWNAIRSSRYDLLITDVDMPRLDGIELIELVRRDASLRSLPIMIVSYKDRDEDRQRGLEAGADHYLTKASFYDETMLQAIEDLIGGPA